MITTVNVMSIPVFASWDLFNGFPKSLWGVVRLADFAVVVSVDFSARFPVLVAGSLNSGIDDFVGPEDLFSSDVPVFVSSPQRL